ncbi:hypothetical protein RJ639_044588 [Escallonia herrerae]|uniref:Serine carboxypeptidase n=1 Tax=Escallonia herrerae TaxID=1293975 RepID=A0AA88WGQ0_9ASTE|nr:hypothetical protein RJ639_044588 [Escallonia herrerae]
MTLLIGNALIDRITNIEGRLDYYWSHALISDDSYARAKLTCNFTSPDGLSQMSAFDPCSRAYLTSYLNIPEVQKSLHANLTGLPYPWEKCRHCYQLFVTSEFDTILGLWTDRPDTVLPIIQELMRTGMRVWIYSGDTDMVVPVTATRYAINKLKISVKTGWHPWYIQGEVGAYAVGYQNLTFVTVRGAGHYVPIYASAPSFYGAI